MKFFRMHSFGRQAVILPTEFPPQSGAFSMDLQDKSKSPSYSPGVGAMVTND